MFLPKNYMRSLRKRAGLMQRDIAYLLAYQNSTFLSQLETGKCAVSLRIALAYQVLFGILPAKLVPRKFNEVQEAVRTRAGMLATELEKQESTPSLTSRIALLREIERGGRLNKTTAYGKS